MNAELIHVGTELLLGDILNTNAQYLSKKLAELGINLYYQTVVGDNTDRLTQLLKLASKRSDLVIITGGLGPTQDDLTKESVCQFLNKSLILREDVLLKIKEMFKARNKKMPKNNVKQAMFPSDCMLLDNDMGTAPGLFIQSSNAGFYLLPGPPTEMKNMFTKQVMPLLEKQVGQTIYSKSLKVFGIGESMAEMLISDLLKDQSNPTIAPYAHPYGMEFRLTAKAPRKDLAKELLLPIEKEVRKRLGDNIFGIDAEELENAAFNRLKEKNFTISTAESCTGGLIASKLVNLDGASSVFLGSIVSYSNNLKNSLLDVPLDVLSSDGAVSEACAIKMAEGICKKTGSNVGISTTGVAGPTGGTLEKPVGLVYIGLSVNGETSVYKHNFVGNRNSIRERAARQALDHLRRYLRHL